MDFDRYLTEFKKAAALFDRDSLVDKKLELEVGVWLQSVVLRFQKAAWANKPYERPQSDTAIFFSVWVNDKAIKEDRLFYNIHALKLRKLKGYKITSREFASAFRDRFKSYEQQWLNVRVDFGPLTLMEGWKPLNGGDISGDVFSIAHQFLSIDPLIDELLAERAC